MQYYLVLTSKTKKSELTERAQEFLDLVGEEGKILRVMTSLNLLWVEVSEKLDLNKLKELTWAEDVLPVRDGLTGEAK